MTGGFGGSLELAAEDAVFEGENRGLAALGVLGSPVGDRVASDTAGIVPFEVFDPVVSFVAVDVTDEGAGGVVVCDEGPGDDLGDGVVAAVAVLVDKADDLDAALQGAALEHAPSPDGPVAVCRLHCPGQTHDFAGVRHHVASLVPFYFLPDHRASASLCVPLITLYIL